MSGHSRRCQSEPHVIHVRSTPDSDRKLKALLPVVM
jgi:hypothetical protein